MAIIKSIDLCPEVYWRESDDFQVFLTAIDQAFDETFDKTERIVDCLDPLCVEENLLPHLAHRLGFVYDWRFQAQFNRLVLYHFPQMIYNRGSRTGVTLGAMVNLASIGLDALDATSKREYDYFLHNNRDAYSRGIQVGNNADRGGDPNLRIDSEAVNYEPEIRAREITDDRLDDTSLPNNAVSVSVNDFALIRDNKGNIRMERNEPYYINVVYFSETVPTDACLEYVRPLGMYLFTHSGIKISAKNEILLHPKLADQFADNTPVGELPRVTVPHPAVQGSQRIDPDAKFSPSIYGGVGNYNREDFATLQQYDDPVSNPQEIVPQNDLNHPLYQASNTPEFQQWLLDNAMNFDDEAYRATPNSNPPTTSTGSVVVSNGTLNVNGVQIFPSPMKTPLPNHNRRKFWSRNNSDEPDPRNFEGTYDAGYNTLYSFQLSNNEQTVKKLMPKVFELGYLPTHSRHSDVTVDFMEGDLQEKTRMFNLQYADSRLQEEALLKDKIRFGDDKFVSNNGDWAFAPSVNPTLEHYPPSDEVNAFADGTVNANPKPNTDEQANTEKSDD